MWGGRYCREGEGSKAEMVWTRKEEMKESQSETLWNEEIRICGVVDIAEKVMEERLRWYGHVIL
jgi:hypothetical protein